MKWLHPDSKPKNPFLPKALQVRGFREDSRAGNSKPTATLMGPQATVVAGVLISSALTAWSGSNQGLPNTLPTPRHTCPVKASVVQMWLWASLLGQEEVAHKAMAPLSQHTCTPSLQREPARGDGGAYLSGFGAQRNNPEEPSKEPQTSVALPHGTLPNWCLKFFTPVKTLVHTAEVTVGKQGAVGSTGTPCRGLWTCRGHQPAQSP